MRPTQDPYTPFTPADFDPLFLNILNMAVSEKIITAGDAFLMGMNNAQDDWEDKAWVIDDIADSMKSDYQLSLDRIDPHHETRKAIRVYRESFL
jgi:hypothetical protein